MPWVAQSGTTGKDYSANAAIATGTLLATIPANLHRNAIGVQNQSAAAIQLIRDDGAGNNTTILILSGANQANAQGADWSSNTFKGRLQIYGAAGSQVAAWED